MADAFGTSSVAPKPSRIRRLQRRLLPYLVPYLIFVTSALSCSLTDRLVLIPSTHPIRVGRAEARMIETPAGLVEVIVARSRAVRDEGPAAFVLEFTGNATRAEEIAEDSAYVWQRHAVEVWAVNYPGYGKSAGPARLQAVADAALAVHDDLRRVAGDRPIFVVGTSLGTAAALHVSARRDVAGVVLTNPPPLRQLIRGKFGWWNLWLLAGPIAAGVPADLDSLANARRSTAPALVVTSGRDEVVPLAYQRQVADAYAGPKRVLNRDAARHNDAMNGLDGVWMTENLGWLVGNAERRVPSAE